MGLAFALLQNVGGGEIIVGVAAIIFSETFNFATNKFGDLDFELARWTTRLR